MADFKFENLTQDALDLVKDAVEHKKLNNATQGALKTISEGKDVTKVTKSSMVDLINFLLKEYEWMKEDTGKSPDAGSFQNQKPESSAKTATKDLKVADGGDEIEEADNTVKDKDSTKDGNDSATKVCHFYKSGKCSHGKNGKGLVNGKTCAYLHPKVCIQSKKFGRCKKEKDCKFMHLNVCHRFVKTGMCNYNDKCKFYHPKQVRMDKKRGESSHSPANNATKGSQNKMESLGENAAFLGQHQGASALVKTLETLTAVMAKALGGLPINNNRVWDNSPFLSQNQA